MWEENPTELFKGKPKVVGRDWKPNPQSALVGFEPVSQRWKARCEDRVNRFVLLGSFFLNQLLVYLMFWSLNAGWTLAKFSSTIFNILGVLFVHFNSRNGRQGGRCRGQCWVRWLCLRQSGCCRGSMLGLVRRTSPNMTLMKSCNSTDLMSCSSTQTDFVVWIGVLNEYY